MKWVIESFLMAVTRRSKKWRLCNSLATITRRTLLAITKDGGNVPPPL
ncbi:unnamed protein product [Spirodela intermedia]|uniref:Uncharacterized protein n=1 Tax=Spirodela intermedia TaxID=51605 RepID=A0A7I8JX69_SPIIN|nr:unnamed protein product [Spirodela intermedia]